MSHYITTHNDRHQSVFWKGLKNGPAERPKQEIHGATVETVYTFDGIQPLDLSSELDIGNFISRSGSTGGNEPSSSKNGLCAAVLVAFPPGHETVMHCTSTVNMGIILEGTVELHLDSGEVQMLTAGDSYTQRGTKHMWKNVGEGVLRMATFSLPIVITPTSDENAA